MIVIFRKWNDGQIIALFPDEPWNTHDNMITSYMHVGQHGPADYAGVINKTTLPCEHEYQELLVELQSIGYNDLCIREQAKRRFR